MGKTTVTYDIRHGVIGADVVRLQRVLNDALGLSLTIDGVYGGGTLAAVKQLQQKFGLPVDGQCAGATLKKARDLGYKAVEFKVGDGNETDAWPPTPSEAVLPQPTAAITTGMFGVFQFEANPGTGEGEKERIRILGGWEAANIVTVDIPQLVGVPIPLDKMKATLSKGKLRCHKLAKDKLVKLFAAWDAAGLTDRILTFDGSFNARLKRGLTQPLAKNLSNHSWGATFDINADLNPQSARPVLMGGRGCIRELAKVANDMGIYWGGHFGKRDGMHFEIAKL
ncbi:MAG: M15 family metallopeptidase [Pseudomonadota bacterium]